MDNYTSTTKTFSTRKINPRANIILKEEFEERVEKVFHILWEILSKSFGPYGAPTLIYNYPYSHITKDGFTIMKNISMDASETLMDQVIADMAADVCGRLNYSVGDGTTSAVIATNSIYKSYRDRKQIYDSLKIPSREIINSFNVIKEDVIKRLKECVISTRSLDPDTLAKNIYDVVYISSNGNEEISQYISDFYRELGFPSVSCELAPDGITKKKLIQGYQYELSLTDKLYINSDTNTMELDEADIIIFDTKVTRSIYQHIIKPLNSECFRHGRHLIVAAPKYDEKTIMTMIRQDLLRDYENRKDVNLVLTSYRAAGSNARRLLDDFSVLCNTTPINLGMATEMIRQLTEENLSLYQVLNIDSRSEIPGIKNLLFTPNLGLGNSVIVNYNLGDDISELLNQGYKLADEPLENAIRLGYAKNISLGLKNSVIHTFFYNENRYQAILKDAKDVLYEMEEKYKKLATFNLDVTHAQNRYYALRLKMGIIEVGGDSELSQKMVKDSVDDAIKAAASAFNYGMISGCNVTLIRCLIQSKLAYISKNETPNEEYIVLYDTLINGFKDVYRTVLINTFETDSIILKRDTNGRILLPEYFEDEKIAEEVVEKLLSESKDINLLDLIINYSIKTNLVFDVTKKIFSNTVINSEQTDEEILKATIELIGLLIVGNQVVVTGKHNFE